MKNYFFTDINSKILSAIKSTSKTITRRIEASIPATGIFIGETMILATIKPKKFMQYKRKEWVPTYSRTRFTKEHAPPIMNKNDYN